MTSQISPVNIIQVPKGTGAGILEPPTGLGEQESAFTQRAHRDQGSAAPMGHGVRRVALQDLAVSLGLVPPHRCDPLQHLHPPGELLLWLWLHPLFSRGPHVGLQCNGFRAVTRGFPPKAPRIMQQRPSAQQSVARNGPEALEEAWTSEHFTCQSNAMGTVG
ncbi:hypothetical protein EYF80_050226 [Liparis tanakae]|uniref:Uncharacterized protein n=1 Tax=Liparis tanakae TaxID=230148 RepID=A0A4Z2FEN5_9TELE|nr:hypothetical protein EYF80_050226 [Liparis tanakae]